ncbi:hypothetical protein MKZ38_006893 [Zalerion maritima]|uniref:Uncharacterized protein n=1 Tax=Zalerion maritima TaxID=339359 RepID=A0AAD5WN77_9PEZI|nr:hypothetical protein MKZ38_006893 [Zalerion maritima]
MTTNLGQVAPDQADERSVSQLPSINNPATARQHSRTSPSFNIAIRHPLLCLGAILFVPNLRKHVRHRHIRQSTERSQATGSVRYTSIFAAASSAQQSRQIRPNLHYTSKRSLKKACTSFNKTSQEVRCNYLRINVAALQRFEVAEEGGIAAWILNKTSSDGESESSSDESPPEPDFDYDNADYGANPAYGASDERPSSRDFDEHPPAETGTGPSWGARVSGALRRTPSPQQFMESAIAATGAAIQNTLTAIREEDKSAFADHETWSEEADARNKSPSPEIRDPGTSRRRRTVAIVVSADSSVGDFDDTGFHEHATILSHIPKNIDFNRIRLFVLIYAPGLKDHPLEPSSNLPPPSLDSSYSKIEPGDAVTPGSEKSPLMTASNTSNSAFNAVQAQALHLVEKETMVLPFTSVNGHVHILRHLQPEVVYLQESLSGDNGSVVNHIQTWMKYDICLVVGSEGGHGALADSESESERADRSHKWWQHEDRAGKGRGVVVVDGMRVHDDWLRRVEGRE